MALGAASAVLYTATLVSALWLAYDANAARREFAVTCAGLVLAGALVVLVRVALDAMMVGTGVICGVGATVLSATGFTGGTDQGATAAGLAILTSTAMLGLVPTDGRILTWRAVVTGVTVVAGAAGLIAIEEWSAITGLVVGAVVGGWLSWRASGAVETRRGAIVDRAVQLLLAIGLGAYAITMFATTPPVVPDSALPEHIVGRRDLWHDALTMTGDYLFTGTGLGGPAMVMSSYAWFRHVLFHPHAHNLFVQVALEQGAPGCIGLVGMFAAGFWTLASLARTEDSRVKPYAPIAGAALAAVVGAGLFESDLVGSPLQLLVFLPIGLAFGLGLAVLERRERRRRTKWIGPALVALAPIALVTVMATLPGGRAQWHANLGATLQTRVELRLYQWPQWPIQDALRRAADVDLEPAIGQYRAALALDSGNATAHRRRGQIELSRGRVDAALVHLETAVRTAPGDRAAARLMAEAYAITGQSDAAVSIWLRTRSTREELEPRVWWYTHVGPALASAQFESAIRALDAKRRRLVDEGGRKADY